MPLHVVASIEWSGVLSLVQPYDVAGHGQKACLVQPYVQAWRHFLLVASNTPLVNSVGMHRLLTRELYRPEASLVYTAQVCTAC